MKQPHPPLSKSLPKKSAPKKSHLGSLLLWLFLGLGAALAVYFFGILPRQTVEKEIDQETRFNLQRHVLFATVEVSSSETDLSLPGTIEAFQQASLSARTSGYVRKWYFDLGHSVKEGDILAELETPEVDQQLNQARAALEQAKANAQIAATTAERYNQMRETNAVSSQEIDQYNAARDSQMAAVQVAQAEVNRLTELQNFRYIRAPFAGTITYRGLEVGNLVTVGNGAGTELYRLAQLDPLRIFVHVPENSSPFIHPGVRVKIISAARPGRTFMGQVARTSGVLDTASRTLLTEIQVDNHDQLLLPGYFVQVHLQITNPHPVLLIPANTLLVNGNGTQAVILKENDQKQMTIHYQPITVGRDLGTKVEILDGLHQEDRLVANPPADLLEDEIVSANPVPPERPVSQVSSVKSQ